MFKKRSDHFSASEDFPLHKTESTLKKMNVWNVVPNMIALPVI